MRKLPAGTLRDLLLIAILGIYGFRLVTIAVARHEVMHNQPVVEAQYRRKAFSSESGLDVLGRFVKPAEASGANRTIVFLLRGATVKTDLEYWHQVRSLLPRHSGLRLIAYCDGDTCLNAIRHEVSAPEFPVIEFGEIVSSQALFDADINGDCVLRIGSGIGQNRSLLWRAPGQTPSALVHEALQ